MALKRRATGILLLFLALAAIPIVLVALKLGPSKDDVLFMDGPAKSYHLTTRREALGKPILDFSFFGTQVRLPSRQVTPEDIREFDDPKVSALLRASPGSGVAFADYTLEAEGQEFEHELGFFAPDASLNLPYAFGKEPVNIRLRPQPKAAWIALRLPGNGQEVVTPADREIKHGNLTIRFHFRKIVLQGESPVVEITIVGAKPGESFGVESFELGTRNYLRCDETPGVLHIDSWDQNDITLEITPLRSRRVELPFSRTDGANTSIKIYDPDHRIMIDATYSGTNVKVNGNPESASSVFTLDDVAPDSLRHEMWTGLSADRGFSIDEYRKIRKGQRLRATEYVKGKPFTISLKLGLPPMDSIL